MSKAIGPCFVFKLKKEGADIDFVFLPGNISRKVYEDTCDALYDAVKSRYTISTNNYIKRIVTEDGINALAIKQTKTLSIIRIVMDSFANRGFKVKVIGLDRDNNEKVVLVNTPTEYQNAAEAIPYFNKNNNDLTTRRRK